MTHWRDMHDRACLISAECLEKKRGKGAGGDLRLFYVRGFIQKEHPCMQKNQARRNFKGAFVHFLRKMHEIRPGPEKERAPAGMDVFHCLFPQTCSHIHKSYPHRNTALTARKRAFLPYSHELTTDLSTLSTEFYLPVTEAACL